MITEESYKELLQKIVENHLPDEKFVFMIQGTEIVKNAFNDKPELHEQGRGEQYQMIDPSMAKTILEIIVVAFNGFKTIQEIRKVLIERDKNEQDNAEALEELKLSLEKRLIASKISRVKAKAIAEDFSAEAVKALSV